MGRSAIAVMSERFGHRPAPTVGTACEAPVHVVTCVRDGFDPYRWVMDTRNPVLAREATQYATFGKQSAAARRPRPRSSCRRCTTRQRRRVVSGVWSTATVPSRSTTSSSARRPCSSCSWPRQWSAGTSSRTTRGSSGCRWSSALGPRDRQQRQARRQRSAHHALRRASRVSSSAGSAWLYDDIYGTRRGSTRNIVGQAVFGTLLRLRRDARAVRLAARSAPPRASRR